MIKTKVCNLQFKKVNIIDYRIKVNPLERGVRQNTAGL